MKNIVIAFLMGIIATQACRADVASGITRADLIYAAAICGTLANSHLDPNGLGGSGWGKFNSAVDVAKETAKQCK